jgi:carbon-monoxide dehydrogenase large subunit
VPRAHDFPLFESHHTETPTDVNPMGVKGIGEAATIGATPATANAVIDALEPFGITHLDVPLTPQKIWQAIQGAKGGASQAAD